MPTPTWDNRTVHVDVREGRSNLLQYREHKYQELKKLFAEGAEVIKTLRHYEYPLLKAEDFDVGIEADAFNAFSETDQKTIRDNKLKQVIDERGRKFRALLDSRTKIHAHIFADLSIEYPKRLTKPSPHSPNVSPMQLA